MPFILCESVSFMLRPLALLCDILIELIGLKGSLMLVYLYNHSVDNLSPRLLVTLSAAFL